METSSVDDEGGPARRNATPVGRTVPCEEDPMQIHVFEVDAFERDLFEPLTAEHDVRFHEEPLTPENVHDAADAEVISPFIYSQLGGDTLSRLERLKLIATRSTGVDQIDMNHCEANDVTVANVPSYGKNTVAEHAFALLLAVSRHVVRAAERASRGDFTYTGLRGFDLLGKTLGVLGTGDIGEHVLRIGRGFGMELLAFDVVRRDDLADEIGFTYVDFDDLLRRSDVITIHVPLNEATQGMLDREAFAKAKDGMVLINTSRGPIVDAEALTDALANGKVAAAGLDVLAEERAVRDDTTLLDEDARAEHDTDALLADHVLLRQDNVLVTPHIGFNTREAVRRIVETTIGNILAFDRGEAENTVTGGGA